MITDLELIQKVQTQEDNDSLKELINRHSSLCYSMYQKYSSRMIESGVANVNSFEDKDYLIYATAKSYNPNKNSKYSSWLANNVRFYCLNTMKAQREIAHEDKDIDTILESRRDTNLDNYYLNISYVNSLLEQFKDKRIKKIFQLRYFEHPSKNWQEIGAEMKLSHTTCVILHNKAKEILKKKLLSTANFDKI